MGFRTGSKLEKYECMFQHHRDSKIDKPGKLTKAWSEL